MRANRRHVGRFRAALARCLRYHCGWRWAKWVARMTSSCAPEVVFKLIMAIVLTTAVWLVDSMDWVVAMVAMMMVMR